MSRACSLTCAAYVLCLPRTLAVLPFHWQCYILILPACTPRVLQCSVHFTEQCSTRLQVVYGRRGHAMPSCEEAVHASGDSSHGQGSIEANPGSLPAELSRTPNPGARANRLAFTTTPASSEAGLRVLAQPLEFSPGPLG